MLKIVSGVFSLVRGLFTLVVVGALGYGAWYGYNNYYMPILGQLHQKEAEIQQLHADLETKQLELEKAETALKLIKTDHRVAKMAVVDQWRRPQDNRLMTSIAFAEVDDAGRFLDGYKTYTIEGDVVYVDTWVAKFLDEHVEQGVPLRSSSLCLFRRIFGEYQQPQEGFELDAAGSQPLAYNRGKQPSELEQQIWSNFWEYANNPAQAEQIGLRALQGEAPSIKLMPNKVYWIMLRASDGLTIKATDRPPQAISSQGPPQRGNIQQTGYSRNGE